MRCRVCSSFSCGQRSLTGCSHGVTKNPRRLSTRGVFRCAFWALMLSGNSCRRDSGSQEAAVCCWAALWRPPVSDGSSWLRGARRLVLSALPRPCGQSAGNAGQRPLSSLVLRSQRSASGGRRLRKPAASHRGGGEVRPQDAGVELFASKL